MVCRKNLDSILCNLFSANGKAIAGLSLLATHRHLLHPDMPCYSCPWKIVYATLYACLVSVGAKVSAPFLKLLDSFIDYLTTVEQSVVKMGLGMKVSVFPINMQNPLVYTRLLWLKKNSKPHDLRQLLIEAGEYNILHMPLAAISSIHSGIYIPPHRLPFWSKYTVAQFYTIFNASLLCPQKLWN